MTARAGLLYTWNTKSRRWDGYADVVNRYDLYTTYQDRTRDVPVDGSMINVSGDFLINGDNRWTPLNDNLQSDMPNSIFPNMTSPRLFNASASLQLDEIYLSSFQNQRATILDLEVEFDSTTSFDLKSQFTIEFNVSDMLSNAVAVGLSKVVKNQYALRAAACFTGYFIKKELADTVLSVTVTYVQDTDPKKNSEKDILNFVFGARIISASIFAELKAPETVVCHLGCPSRSVPWLRLPPEKSGEKRRLYPSLDAYKA